MIYCPTAEMIADIFTKQLGRILFQRSDFENSLVLRKLEEYQTLLEFAVFIEEEIEIFSVMELSSQTLCKVRRRWLNRSRRGEWRACDSSTSLSKCDNQSPVLVKGKASGDQATVS